MRRRILLVIGITLVVMLTIISLVTDKILMDSFATLERRYLERDVERARNAIAGALSDISSTLLDWSSWDETWTAARSSDQAYINANVTDTVLENLRLNILLLLDVEGSLVFGRSFDSAARTQGGIPESLARWLASHPSFSRSPSERAHSEGIVSLPEGALLAAARPVLRNQGQGPVYGTLVMGRFLDGASVAHLAESLRLSLAVMPWGSPEVPRAAAEAMERPGGEGSAPSIDASRADTVSAYAPLRDLDGAPALVLRVDAPRDIQQQGIAALRFFRIWLVVIGLVFGGVVLLVVERTILSRLLRLSAGVLAVGTGADPSKRVSIEGRDQIAYLAAAINGMLDALARSTEELRSSERRNEAFLDAVPDVIFRITRDGTILDARSPAKIPLVETADALVGRDPEEILSLYSFISPEQLERSAAATARALDTGIPQTLEFTVETEGGKRSYEERFVPSGENEAIALVRDVTALAQAAEAQRSAVLLKEIHHRVKNNLQVISSLLALQATAAPDARTRALLGESRDRVRTMALIHEKLYQAGDERGMSFASYVRDLAAHLRSSYAGRSEEVKVEFALEEVSLPMDLSVPCGLMINELLSNALKYAFPDKRAGTITISLGRGEDATLVLSVRDDGIGFPAGVDLRDPATLGLRIVNILAAQIGGTLALGPGPGASFTLTFPSP